MMSKAIECRNLKRTELAGDETEGEGIQRHLDNRNPYKAVPGRRQRTPKHLPQLCNRGIEKLLGVVMGGGLRVVPLTADCTCAPCQRGSPT